jgi:hypothetical protein
MTCQFPWRLLQAAVPGHEYNARDDITLKTTVWLPGPRAAEAHVPQSQRVIGDSPPHASAFGGQLSMPVMNAPIEVDTVGLPFLLSYGNSRDHRWKKAQINTPHHYVRGKCNDVSSSLELAAAAARPNTSIAAEIPTYINNNDLQLSIILTTTDA